MTDPGPTASPAPTLEEIRAAWTTLTHPGVRLINRFLPARLHALAQQEGLDYLALMTAFGYVKPGEIAPEQPRPEPSLFLDERGFVFLDAASRPYLVRMYGGDPWLFYWHPDDQADLYHQKQAEWAGRLAPGLFTRKEADQ